MLREDQAKPSGMFEPGKLIVQRKPGVLLEEELKTRAELGYSPAQQISELNIDIINVEPGTELENMGKYKASGLFCFVEPNYYFFPDYKPNDPFYTKKTVTTLGPQRQWGLRQINPEKAWDETYNLTPSLKIAIIDTGIDPNHPDLAGKIVDPMNFFTADPNDYIDLNGHGTWTAGIAAAITDNKTGIAGTSFNTAFIMPLKVGDTSLPLSAIINAIIYAVQNGARVINMSIGATFYSAALQNAIDFAWSNGAVIIASAGNSGSEQPNYPASNNFVLGVSATDKSDSLAPFSNWGVNIGVAAPGVAILGTTPTYAVPGWLLNYDAADGTSASAPFVSGVAALLFALRPALTNQEAVRIIEQAARIRDDENDEDDEERSENTRDHDDFEEKAWDPLYGYGLLDAGRAVGLIFRGKKPKCGLGSFFGQILDQQGLPIGGITVSAVRNDKALRLYETKTNVPTLTDVGSDGIFRLMNLRKGTYDIYANGQLVQSAVIVPGSDVYLRLIV